MTDAINHLERAISRLAVQFKESPNLVGYIQAILAEGQDLETVFQQILNERTITNAVGEQLDVLGEIVGQPRYVKNGFFPKFFGFAGNVNAAGFGEATFWNGTDPLIVDGDLTDDVYRLYILAKAFTNSADSTHDDFIEVFKILFGEETRTVTEDLGNANCHIIITHNFTPEEEQLLINGKANQTLPLAAGINYTFSKTGGTGTFGFAGNPLAVGFGNGGFYADIGD